jgi:hypothetical protein
LAANALINCFFPQNPQNPQNSLFVGFVAVLERLEENKVFFLVNAENQDEASDVHPLELVEWRVQVFVSVNRIRVARNYFTDFLFQRAMQVLVSL